MKKSYFILSGLVVILDQITKYLMDRLISPHEAVSVLPFLQLINVKNTGAAFGLFKEFGNFFFIAVSIAAIVFITVMLLRGREHKPGLSLILGGAAGNLIDRIIYGSVRDFIDVYAGGYHWPAFNVADSALTIGIALILLSAAGGKSKR